MSEAEPMSGAGPKQKRQQGPDVFDCDSFAVLRQTIQPGRKLIDADVVLVAVLLFLSVPVSVSSQEVPAPSAGFPLPFASARAPRVSCAQPPSAFPRPVCARPPSLCCCNHVSSFTLFFRFFHSLSR